MTEASARLKFKLITKNKMFGEARFSWSDMSKLKEGKYAFALHATIDDVQLVLAVSKPFAKAGERAIELLPEDPPMDVPAAGEEEEEAG